MKIAYFLAIVLFSSNHDVLAQSSRCIKGDCVNGFGVLQDGSTTIVRDFSDKNSAWWKDNGETGIISMGRAVMQIFIFPDGKLEMGYFVGEGPQLYNGLGFEGGRMYKVVNFEKTFLKTDYKSNECLSGDCMNGPSGNLFYGGPQGNFIIYGTYKNGALENENASIVINSTFTGGSISLSEIPKNRDFEQMITLSHNVEKATVKFGKGMFEDELFLYKIEPVPPPVQKQAVATSTSNTQRVNATPARPRTSFWDGFLKGVKVVGELGIEAGNAYLASQNAQSNNANQQRSQPASTYSKSTNTNVGTARPRLGYDEIPVRTLKGVSVSYTWELANSAANNDGEMIYAWRITVYVQNHSGMDKRMAPVVISPLYTPAALLPQGWSNPGGISFTMIDSGSMADGELQSEPFTIFTRNSNVPSAPSVALTVHN